VLTPARSKPDSWITALARSLSIWRLTDGKRWMQTDVREVSGCFHAHTSRVVGSLEVVRAGDEGWWRASLPLKEGRRLRAPTRSNFEFSKNLQRAVNRGYIDALEQACITQEIWLQFVDDLNLAMVSPRFPPC
jgi:hypothetical protein